MKALIVCTSVSHGNTKRVADVMAEVLDAQVVEPEQVDPAELAAYDLVGFGSGIFYQNFHPRLRELITSLPAAQGQPAFVFATSGFPEPACWRYGRRLGKRLERRGFAVADTFLCRGFDTSAPFELIGGVRKGHPDAADLAAARVFAEGLRARIGATH